MKSLSITEAKFIYYVHNKLNYDDLNKVKKVQQLMEEKFPESDRSIDAHSYYKALKNIGEGGGVPSECILCGMDLTDEHMMCVECAATIHSMASRGYKEVKEEKDREAKTVKRKHLFLVGIIAGIIALVLGIVGTVILVKMNFKLELNDKLQSKGYVTTAGSENPYSADMDIDLQNATVVNADGPAEEGISDENDGEEASLQDASADNKDVIYEINASRLDIRDSFNMLGRSYEIVFSVYGNPTSTKNGKIYYEKSGTTYIYDETSGEIYQIYADEEVSDKNKNPICSIYVGLDMITAINELSGIGLEMNQVDIYTWEGICECDNKIAKLKITEKNGKVGVIFVGAADILQ